MNYLNKDKHKLIKFWDQLKNELEFAKLKVKVSEKIMADLKATGQESVEALIKNIDAFEAKKIRLENEIAKVSYIVQAKENQSELRNQKIEDCTTFIETQSGLQQQKIENLNDKITDKKQYILELKREIVSLEYKCEAQENNIVDLDRRIEDKVFDKILGNEQLQDYKQQNSDIVAKYGGRLTAQNLDLDMENHNSQNISKKGKSKKNKTSKRSSSKAGSKSNSRAGSKMSSILTTKSDLKKKPK